MDCFSEKENDGEKYLILKILVDTDGSIY